MSKTKADASPRVGDRLTFPGISRHAYEHPADKAALVALRKVPGFDLMLRKLIGLIGERSLRQLYLASAVRVTDTQFSKVHGIYQECLDIMDLRERPELFIAQTPIVNAGAIGTDRPFIVLNSGTLDLFSEDELRFIIGHELGHIISDHVLYKTMLRLLLSFSLGRLGIPFAPLVLYGIVAALKEWDRKSELSGDRAGLLCAQDVQVAYTVHMKMAGGNKTDQMDVDEFVRQTEDYEKDGNLLDSMVKVLNLIWRTHPFHVLRLAELKRWIDSGGYQTILAGEYERREKDEDVSVYEAVKEGAGSYQESAQNSKDPMFRFLQDLSSKAKGLFSRGAGESNPED